MQQNEVAVRQLGELLDVLDDRAVGWVTRIVSYMGFCLSACKH
jgi:hypothetical protein